MSKILHSVKKQVLQCSEAPQQHISGHFGTTHLKCGGSGWTTEHNLLLSALFISSTISDQRQRAAGKPESGLGGTPTYKQTQSLHARNCVTYTATFPTDSEKLSFPKHTNTHNAVSKLVCERGKSVYARASLHRHCHKAFSAARDPNCKVMVIIETRHTTHCGQDAQRLL